MVALSHVALVFDIDGVVRDVSQSYRRALADTVEQFTAYRPTPTDIDNLKAEGLWNNDWEASQELIRRTLARGDRLAEMPEYAAVVSFFQSRYRGEHQDDPQRWTGYITSEPLIATPNYLQTLTLAEIAWGFFSGATRASARYVLDRLGVAHAALVAMEDAPGKPDPTGLFDVLTQIGDRPLVVYVGDTAADMLTVREARQRDRERTFVAVGVIPPHVQQADPEGYAAMLRSRGADVVLDTVLELTPEYLAVRLGDENLDLDDLDADRRL